MRLVALPASTIGVPSGATVNAAPARKALAAFVGTIVSRGAAVDSGTMSSAARRSALLFEGRAGCTRCHTGARFSDDRPHNTGVPDNPEIWADPERHSAFVTYAKFMGVENRPA